MTSTPAALRRPGALLGLVLLAVVGAYSASPLGSFVWDDVELIVNQKVVRDLQPLSTYFDRMFFGGPVGAPTRSFYRPLVTLSFAVDWQVWGGSPLGFHVTNLLVHLACTVLVFVVARRWGAAPLAASFGAAAFGLLPRLSEAVAWISGRTDLLASLFVLAALATHPASKAENRERPPGHAKRWAASSLLLLGLLSKEVAIAGVIAILALELASARSRPVGERHWWTRLGPPAFAIASYSALRVFAELSTKSGSRVPSIAPADRLLVSLEALGTYVWMLADPFRPRTQIGSIHERTWPLLAVGVISCAILVSFAARHRSNLASAGWGWASLALISVPIALVLHLIPLPLKVTAADRFLYLPASALAITGAVSSRRWNERWRRAAAVLTIAFLPVAATATYVRTLDWQDELTLWADAAVHAPGGNSLPFVELGIALSRADRPEEALPVLERAEAIDADLSKRGIGDPNGSGSREARAVALSALGRFDDALSIFERQRAARPSEPSYAYNCAVVRAMALDFDGARSELLGLLARYPDYDDARAFLAVVERSAEAWRRLPAADGDDARSALARAAVFAELGRLRDATKIWRELASDERTPGAVRAEATRRLPLR